mmetsp:Transcript_41694/g.46544  ORF Transcript_41694/g.46544 Transcript_41694/m.46544 type:complete len:259 (-) Transcript_41694:117-893(-)|eukprot:CAMPEP_0170838860 /NCGR_PEP_ID=MMETSP0734-20130129/3657_1 /TAXON_ID=186038 /ORGANISM="Fragilariopsis kerguelensis, Strain L26-C5" /LENGTH=258 /DNA_ID=CAMNT_0011206405 /DNA_START=302 /DNA_END=1078 /DNA_ORIENTATION=-
MKFIATTPLLVILVIVASIATSCSGFTTSPVLNRVSSTTTNFVAKSSTGPLEVFRGGPLQAASSFDDEKDSSLSNIFTPVTDVIVTVLRVGTCALLIHHGFDKVQNVVGFSENVVAKFFGFLPGNPQFWTLSAAGTQIVGSVLLSVGFLTRPVAISMCATMAVAVIFHLLNTGAEGFPLAVVPQHSYNFELAAMYVAVLTYFSAAGAGAYSVDNLVLGGELNFYESTFKKIFDGEEEEAFVEEPVIEDSKSFKLPWSK